MTAYDDGEPDLPPVPRGTHSLPRTALAHLKLAIREYLPIGLVSMVIALVVVRWVGRETIYAGSAMLGRTRLHEAVLSNQLPQGVETWGALGANGLNVRVATVWLVERVHQVSGLRIDLIYQMLDIVGIIIGLLLTYRLLRHWHSRELATGGTVLLGALLPLTMFFHLFHPWDKPAFVLWAGMILAAVVKQWSVFFICYVLAVLVKFDAIFAAGIPLVLFTTRRAYFAPLGLSTGAAIVGSAMFLILTTLIPGGVEPRDLSAQLALNLSTARGLGGAYPPLLVHGLLAVLGGLAWRDSPPMLQRLWVFGLLLLIPHAVLTNFVEVRAQVGSTLCMLPLAILALSTRGPVGQCLTPPPGGPCGE